VTGHTDRAGSLQHNDRLSLTRAKRVRDELVRRGVAPAKLGNVSGRGERELLIPTPDNVFEPRNRRVEIGVR
jgi:outer membrane protein OmpA-like peptidoglycan-associated protein